jgi:hypothetical protein
MTARYINLNAPALEAAPTCNATGVAVRLNYLSRFPSGAVCCLITTQPPVSDVFQIRSCSSGGNLERWSSELL